MMDSPFYRSQWESSPRYPTNFRSVVPVATSRTSSFPSTHKPKVVSIPVQFIQSEESSCPKPIHNTRSDCAVRIQKLWRGFRVRKNVKKVQEIQRELDEVDTIILDTMTVQSLRRDERERLKLTERLMNLLFRLDSIGSFDFAVKDLRRSFIRRTIVLQEKVDSFAIVDQAEESNCENLDSISDSGKREEESEFGGELKCDNQFVSESGGKLNCEDQEFDSDSESCGTDNPSSIEEESKPEEREIVVVKEEKIDSSEILKRMVEDNNRLMALMQDLYDRSEMQSRILNSLSERVEQLENEFACEHLWRRVKKQKKTRNSNSKSIDTKDCWSSII